MQRKSELEYDSADEDVILDFRALGSKTYKPQQKQAA